MRDGTGIIQAVMSKAAVGDELFEGADHLSQETSLIVTGTVRADKRAPGGYELDVKQLRGRRRVARLPDHAEGARRRLPDGPPAPVAALRAPARDPARPPRGHRRGPRLLRRARLHARRRADLHARRLRGHDDAVRRSTSGEKAYLTQSGQLYIEAAAMAFGRVYCFGPTFRAEKSKTRRHLTEFWMVEPEMAYADLDDDMDLAEGLIVVGRRARAREAPRAS